MHSLQTKLNNALRAKPPKPRILTIDKGRVVLTTMFDKLVTPRTTIFRLTNGIIISL